MVQEVQVVQAGPLIQVVWLLQLVQVVEVVQEGVQVTAEMSLAVVT